MNPSGAVIDHVTYDPWGNPTDSNPSAGDRYKFTGQEYDSVTGQFNYRTAATTRLSGDSPARTRRGLLRGMRICTDTAAIPQLGRQIHQGLTTKSIAAIQALNPMNRSPKSETGHLPPRMHRTRRTQARRRLLG